MEWISIKDILPEESQHGDRFLVYDKHGYALAHFYDDTCGATCFDGTYRILSGVTHWAELNPPESV